MGVSTLPSEDALPATFDELVAVERLEYGALNPRQVQPREELRLSIRRDGMQRPLIVHPGTNDEVYEVVDGWQRYQAATALGWEKLPVEVYESSTAALEAAETASIVREWSTYTWARHCRSYAAELETDPEESVVRAVTSRVAKSERTVRRYLRVLALPEVLHPLLADGPSGDDKTWAALQNYNSDVRQYSGLSWSVAARLGRYWQDDEVGETRTIAIGANAVEYERPTAVEFIDMAVTEPEMPLRTVHKRIQQEEWYEEYLRVPSAVVRMSSEEKQAVMEYCSEERKTLSEVVETRLRDLATELTE